jgi:hypothetical protein
MKIIKQILSLLVLLTFVAGCTKEKFDDTSFIESATSPDKVSAMFDITQDNTGFVTITPNAEGCSAFDIHFGDTTTKSTLVSAGGKTTHVYPEGVYNVKIVAHGITGKVTETTKQLTVSFKAPENVEITAVIDGSNPFKVNVSAKALYETMFKVTFGDGGVTEVPQSFLEGEPISHIYAAVGTYTIKVVALSGGAASVEYTKDITIVNPVVLPVDFQDGTLIYNFINFGGGALSVINNPNPAGINTSSKVAQMIKNAPETWGGSAFMLGNPIDFSQNKIFLMKVYSSKVGAKVLLKVENATDNSIFYEKEVSTTIANAWEELVFDYSEIDVSKSYQKIVIICDNGTVGDGSANFTYLLDDIRLTKNIPTPSGVTLYNFETGSYTFNDFGGGAATVIANPQSSGINTSSKVGQMIKSAPEVWGGSWIDYGTPLDFDKYKIIKMKVFSPRAGVPVLFKVENLTDGAISKEIIVNTTKANEWEELTFDFSSIDATKSYQKVVLIFDMGTAGDGSANFTFLFDDIRLTTSAPPAGLTLYNFETGTYTFSDFGGGAATVIANPQSSGINTSSTVGQMIKSAPEVWGGSWIDYGTPLDFDKYKTVKMKVFSPRTGVPVLFKVENLTDGAISKEIIVNTTKANQWEELTFDFSSIDATKSYQKVVLIFDMGTAGDGSANFTFLFDDITLN